MMRWIFGVAAVLAISTLALAEEKGLLDTRNRFLDDNIDTSHARLVPSNTPIDSFENADALKKDWQFKGTEYALSEEHATEGKHSLKITFANADAFAGYRRGFEFWGGGPKAAEQTELSSWSGLIIHNDRFVFDVFNPQDKPVTLAVKFGRNLTFPLKPGQNEISIKTADVVDAVYRASGILHSTDLSVVGETAPVTLYLDNVHWVGPGVGENMLKHARLFDCGSSRYHYLRPYFQPLDDTTPYDKQKGFGWENVPTKHSEKFHSTITSSGRQPIDLLLRDSIRNIAHPLLVDLPDGKYRVQWVEGEAFAYFNDNVAMDYDVAVRANGGPLIPVRRKAQNFAERVAFIYGRDAVDYLPGQDRWDAFMRAWFTPMEADVDVTGGQLKLEFITRPVNRANAAFILIYPVDKAAVIEPEIALLWKDLKYRFNVMSFHQTPLDYARSMNMPGLHEELLDPAAAARRHDELAKAAGGDKGLVVFNRHPGDDVYADTVPQRTEIGGPISAAASPGETATLAINLHAFKDLQKLKVTVGEFTGDSGKTIPRAANRLRFVRYSYRMTGQQTHGDWSYLIYPWFLVDRDAIEIRRAMSVRWWLNVDVPAGTAPGAYKAAATVEAAGVAPITAELVLNVRPIAVDPVPAGKQFATYYEPFGPHAIEPDVWSYFTSFGETNEETAQTKKMLREQRMKRMAAEFALMKQTGINAIYVNRMADADRPSKEMLAGIRMFEAAERERGSYLWTLDTHNEKSLATLKDPANALIGARRFDTIAATQEEPNIYRFCAGAFLWRLKAGGCFFKVWRDPLGEPYNAFDYHIGEIGDLADPAGHDWPTMNSSLMLEGAREGILDYRYLATLERLVREKPQHPAAAKARDYLQSLEAAVVPDAAHYFTLVGRHGGWDNTWHQKDTAWKGSDFEKMRESLATHIAALQR